MEILRIYAEKYVSAVMNMQGAVSSMRKPNIWKDLIALHFIQSELEDLQTLCREGELPVTGVLVDGILKPLVVAQENPTLRAVVTPDGFAHSMSQIESRLRDEMSTKIYFQLPASKKAYFETPTAGWEKVLERFPATCRA